MLLQVRNLVSPLCKMHNLKICSAFSSSAFEEEKIKVGNWNINYLKVGNGPHNILCMPGALGSIWTDFKPQLDGLDREKFTIVAWDPPGYGKSRPPERDFPTNLYDRDADYAFEFMKAINIHIYSLLGWSDGGVSSIILAAKHPEVVNKLVVFGSNSFILPQELEKYKKIRDIDTWSKKMKQPMIDMYGEELFRKYWAEWVDGMVALFKAKDGDICSGLLKDVKSPTLILYGEKDPLVDNVHVSHLHTHIVGSRIHLYPEGKHNVHLAYAEDFNKRVQEFLLQPSCKV